MLLVWFYLACSLPIAQAETPLFNRIGGKATLQTLVRSFVETLVKDERLADNSTFQERIYHFRKTSHQTAMLNYFCHHSGGSCEKGTSDLREKHEKFFVSSKGWNFIVHDFVQAMQKLNLGATEQRQLIAILQSMKFDILYRKS